MGALIQQLGNHEHINSVVDLGAGQGYLSRMLAYQYDFQVIAVDESEVQTCGAKRFDNLVVKGYKNKQHLLHHIKDRFTNENAADILAGIQQQLDVTEKDNDNDTDNVEFPNPNVDDKQNDHPWFIVGLHSCGDLSPIMLRLFIQQHELKSLVNVGCCYHFLTHDHEKSTSSPAGFPMSQYVHGCSITLGSIASMLACQAPSRWLDQRESSIKAFEHHFFRALLQVGVIMYNDAKYA